MFLHEFGEDFVLALQLLFQQGDPPVLVVAGAAGAVLECGSGVLEELLLPTVEHRGVNAVLVAQIRHRGVFEEMEPKYGDLLRDAEAIPSFLGHGKTSARDCSLFERLVPPIPTEAKHLHAVACCTNHVHVVVTAPGRDPEDVMDQFKAWCTRRLKKPLESSEPRTVRANWWTQRGSKRWLNDHESLAIAMEYVLEFQNRPGSQA